jgi:hypothetical protein
MIEGLRYLVVREAWCLRVVVGAFGSLYYVEIVGR